MPRCPREITPCNRPAMKGGLFEGRGERAWMRVEAERLEQSHKDRETDKDGKKDRKGEKDTSWEHMGRGVGNEGAGERDLEWQAVLLNAAHTMQQVMADDKVSLFQDPGTSLEESPVSQQLSTVLVNFPTKEDLSLPAFPTVRQFWFHAAIFDPPI